MEGEGHSFLITARDRYPVAELLEYFKIEYINRGPGKKTSIGKLTGMFKNDLLLLKLARKFLPDFFLSFGSPYAAQVSSILRKPNVTLDDTENAVFGQFFYKPFATHIISPSTFSKSFGRKHIKIESYMELCYLSPLYFNPDKSIFSILGLSENEKYIIMRFVAWNANHDIGHKGISLNNKVEAVNEFSKFGKVFISSEVELPDVLKKYQINIPPEKMHDAIAFASLIYGESATMASEGAVLGIPAIYIDNVGRGYTTEEENKYHLVYNFSESPDSQKQSILKGIEVLKDDNIQVKCQQQREKLLNDKINITSFLAWFFDDYPDSSITMVKNPDFQFNFKNS